MTSMNEFHQDPNYPNSTPNPPYGGSSPMAAESNPSAQQNSGWGAPQASGPMDNGAPNRNYGVPVGNPYVPGDQRNAAQQSGFRPPEHTPAQQYSATNGWQQTPPEQKPKKKRKGVKIFLGSVACVLAVAVVGFAGYGVYSLTMGGLTPEDPPVSSSPTITSGSNGGTNLEGINLQDVPRVETAASVDGKLTTEQIVDKVAPSVVAVLIYNNGYTAGPIGMGSGIIIREDGYIVTNAHVVESADGLVVQLSNGDSLEARVVGTDSQTDLAVIKVESTNMPAAVFGNSDQVKVGEKVIAIGNPQSMSFYGTVTQGIVSGLNRQISATDGRGSVTNYTDLIQTDAAINQGNSGGALVNEYGQVIGINAAKAGANGVEGLGFAIPSNDAKQVVDDLINVGHVTGRVLLGITTTGAVNEVEARQGNLPRGIRVASTNEGSDISTKGVLPGDIITKVDETEITSTNDIQTALKGKNPGDSVKLEVYRAPMANGSKKSGFFEVTVKVMEDTGEPAQPSQSSQPQQQQPGYGSGGNNGGYGYGNGGNNGGNGGYVDPFDYFFGQFYN